eukprot:13950084-Heterocapsa_arctica.AAC.1
MTGDAASKRTMDAKPIIEKEGTKANIEGSLEQEKDKKNPLDRSRLHPEPALRVQLVHAELRLARVGPCRRD